MSVKDMLVNLLKVKSLVTLALIGTLVVLMFVPTQADEGLKNLFIAITSSVVTYYFAKDKDKDASQIATDGVDNGLG